MADKLFDEVDEILSENLVDVGGDEKNFNEAELHDIMSEIEDLEKEFSSEDKGIVKSKLSSEVLESELAELGEEDFEGLDVIDSSQVTKTAVPEEKVQLGAARDKPTVLPFEKNQVGYMAQKNPEVTFEAQGQMTLALDFKVGQDSAKLTIDPVKGLSVSVSGVDIVIDDISGCTVTMENGMTFTIPLSTAGKSLKKKSA